MTRRTLTRHLLALSVAAIALGAGSGAARAKPVIEGLVSSLAGDRVMVSFDVKGAMREEILERIHSGIPVRFKHKVEVVRKRVLLWPAKELARTRVITEATYDSLTRQYSLMRRLEVRSRKKRDAVEPEELRQTTESLEEMKRWMTRLRDVPVYDPARALPSKGLRLRVESSLGRRFVLLIFPTTIDASAERRLEP